MRLLSEKPYALYFSPDIIRAIRSIRKRWAELVARMGDRRGSYRVLAGRLGGPRLTWEKDNIKSDLQEVGWEGIDWIDLA